MPPKVTITKSVNTRTRRDISKAKVTREAMKQTTAAARAAVKRAVATANNGWKGQGEDPREYVKKVTHKDGRGAPSVYSQEIIDRIIREVSDGKLIHEVCEPDDMPAASTVFLWLNDPMHADFADAYRQARNCQADAIARRLQITANRSLTTYRTKTIHDAKGKVISKEITEADNVTRAALIVNTDQWLLAKLFPRKYGDRIQVTAEVDDNLLMELARAVAASPQIPAQPADVTNGHATPPTVINVAAVTDDE